jgi:hypothetical protein
MQCVVDKEVTIFIKPYGDLLTAGQTRQRIVYSFLPSQRASVIDLHVCILMYLPSSVSVRNRRTKVAKWGHFVKQARGIII